MKYILLIFIFFSSAIIGQELSLEEKTQNLINGAKDNKYIKKFIEEQKEKDNLTDFFNKVGTSIQLLDSNTNLQEIFDTQVKQYATKDENEKLFKGFKIFYFITKDTSKDLIKSFSYEINKLREIDNTIEVHLLTNGLIGNSFDSMAEYVKNLQSFGVGGLTISFSPWAYEYFNLQKVPAYALSYCEKDYRFKSCNHKFLVRGEMSLLNFFELISDKQTDYKIYYQKLIGAE